MAWSRPVPLGLCSGPGLRSPVGPSSWLSLPVLPHIHSHGPLGLGSFPPILGSHTASRITPSFLAWHSRPLDLTQPTLQGLSDFICETGTPTCPACPGAIQPPLSPHRRRGTSPIVRMGKLRL